MSIHGKFNNTDCLPVTGKDGKTQWIFKLEDLKEVVPADVYEVIEGFTQSAKGWTYPLSIYTLRQHR